MAAPDPEKITFFAKTDARGQEMTFGIKAKDRQRHMYVIGKTGMGKSTLLENMAAQDIQSGEGMAFIDPHGSAIETLLEYVPEDRLDDVVYFAPFDMENPIGFNIMEDVGVDTRHLVVSGLMSTFKKIWEDAWSARMEYILTNALLALIEYPGTTLLSVNRMLADKEYREKVVENVKDPAVKAYWVDEFASYTERFAAEALPAIQNKIGQFTGNPLIRNIIGQPKSSFDVRKMMDEKKILLINLSKGLVGETNADLIGSMLITKIYLAAMSRAELPPAQMKQMPNFYFYVDEFQSFANSTFANILSEARKYHLNLIIAHQYVAQMEDKIRDAVFGNVGTTIAFRTGPFDAEVLETVFAPQFEATDLVNLGFAQIYLSLMIDGVGSQPFSAVTLPPVKIPQISHKQMVIKRSQQNYTKPRIEVEQSVVDSHAPVERIDTAAEAGGGNKGGFSKPSAFHKVGTDKKFPSKKNGQTNGTQNNNPAKPAYSKTKQPEKSPEDLKNILSKMTSTTPAPNGEMKVSQKRPEKVEQKPVTVEQKKAPEKEPPKVVQEKPAPTNDTFVSRDVKKPTEERFRKQPQEERGRDFVAKKPQVKLERERKLNDDSVSKRPEKVEVVSKSSDDLRNILAEMKIKTEQAQSSALVNKKPEEFKKPVHPNSNRGGTKSPEDLRNILKGMVSTEVTNTKVEKRTQEVKKQPVRDSRQKTVLVAESKKVPDNLRSALAKVVSEPGENKRNSVGSPPKPVQKDTTEYKQSSESMVGGVRQPAFVPHVETNQPDAALVKKMLRHNGKEKPPGT